MPLLWGEDDDRIDARTARLLPVDVLQVEPESELIQRERSSDSIGDGGEARQPARAHGLFDQPHVADHQQDEDAPHQMVDVEAAAGRDIVKRPDARTDRVRDDANDAECDQEGDRGQEQPLARLVLEMEAIELSENLYQRASPRAISSGARSGRSRPR